MKNERNKFTKGKIINIVIAVLIYILIMAALNGGMLSRQMSSLLVPICVNVMLAVSLNLITGFLGELTLGHAGFMSIGAYAGSLLTIYLDLPMYVEFIIAILVGGAVAAFFGFLIGVPVLRLRGDYLAIVTLAFGEIIKSVINVIKITNGAKGLNDIPSYSTFRNFTIVYILVILTIILIVNLVNSRHGRAIRSIRDNYIAAESVGIPVSKFKVMAFVISAFFAGVAGVVYAHNVGIIKPTTFDYNKSIEILVIVVLGGMGNIRGSIIAATILTLLPEMLRGADNLRMLIYAIVLIAMMLFNGSGAKERLISSKYFPKFLKRQKGVE
ncbi:branched-chain amino acid ABC transporter permease [Anaerosacchariphilus polymeriproducens]|uniref:Branched-chain amino acid ABC transporter permease n=1 Tax=Anaerosacchariphilus polymeriproducens TaxID=1812858 RepID=A0A371AT70_9FIRM|nr:branched-chain amino acid ABC transporter permease [Anaerosacchariphilus polymeriproducens]RDU22732.1 branched-chain amino acid ABC transporter permease [Anaerosacchariphilus polymeriproducens]